MDTLPEDRVKVFEKELATIQDDVIRSFVIAVLKEVPEYFFHVPASSTGKYHPSYASGEGGLVLHVKAAVGIACDLFNMTPEEFNQFDRDDIIAALILHDCMKHGDGSDHYTVTEHPNLMADKVLKFNLVDHPDWLQRTEEIYLISNLIRTHMGRWTEDYKTKMVVLSKPETKAQKFVHLCDYLASRKHLEFVFDK